MRKIPRILMIGLLQYLLFEIASIGLGLAGLISGSSSSKKSQKAQFQFQALQSASDAETARSNAAILRTQKDAFTRQQGEIIGDITEQGESVYAERAALAAAEGFGGGGTARSVQSGIRRRVNRDVTRVRDSLAAQTDIFNLQRKQQLDQASAFEEQATFASGQAGGIKDSKWWNPLTWF